MVTGGAKRIGMEMCHFFAKKGFNVALHYNSSKEIAQNVSKEIEEKYNVKCKTFEANLKNPNEAQNCIKNAINYFDKIDILINNASFFKEASFENTSLENLMDNFNVHYFSPFVLCQEFANQKLLEDGLIVNILDCNINRNQTKHFAYLQAKKALLSLTQNLACTLAPKIRTNAISPGFIIPEEDSIANEQYFSHKLKQIPLKAQGSANDILQAVEYLLNAKYINGQNIYVDGGSNLLTI